MQKLRANPPSPALVVAVLALIVATSGTAVALTKITSSGQIARGAVNSGDVRNKTLRLGDTSPKLRSALTAGEALGFAHVLGPSADVEEASSRNVTDAQVSHGTGTGSFCFDLPYQPRNAVANVDLAYQDTAFATVELGATAGNCPAGAEVSVSIHLGGSMASAEDDNFFILFH